MGAQGGVGVNGSYAIQGVRVMDYDFLVRNANMVADVLGSSVMAGLTWYNNGTQPLTQVQQVVAVCGPSPCGSGSRGYDTSDYAYTLGYGEASDTGGGTYDSLTPYNTVFQHGEYSNITRTTQCALSVTPALSPSSY